MTRGRRALLRLLQTTTQREIAWRLGVSQQAVSAWATGLRIPSAKHCVYLAHHYPKAGFARLRARENR